VGAHGVGEDLHGDVRLGAERVQMFQLFAHDVGTADDTAQCRFVQDGPQVQQGGQVVDPVLPAQPHLQARGGLFDSELGDRFLDDRVGVGGGLQQSGDHHGLVRVEGGGVRLQGDVHALGDVAVGMPPALLPGFPGHLHQNVDSLLVRHSVERAQVAHVAGADSAVAVLQVTDLRLGDHQPLGHFRALQPTVQAKPAVPGGAS
jgi:hypothetical protein